MRSIQVQTEMNSEVHRELDAALAVLMKKEETADGLSNVK